MKKLTETRTLDGVRQFRLAVDEHWLAFDDETVQRSPVMAAIAKLAEYENAGANSVLLTDRMRYEAAPQG